MEHEGEAPAEFVRRVVGERAAIEGDGAALRVVKPGREGGDGRLARAGATDQRGDRARPQVELEVADDRPPRVVAERDGLEPQATP